MACQLSSRPVSALRIAACCMNYRPRLQLSGQERVFRVATLLSGGQKPMTKNFIFAHDVILDPDTGKIVAVVRDGGVWRDGAKIAVPLGRKCMI